MEEIKKALREVLAELGIECDDFTLEHPTDMTHGDFATNAALVAAKELQKNPRELAETLKAKLEEKEIRDVERIEVAGPGFINFFLTKAYFLENLQKILEEKDTYGSNARLEGKTIMVEYTQPNPFKVFHIGHLMSNTIGESLTRLLEANGAKVIRANYQGDVGLHVAKALWGVRDLGLKGDTVEEWGEGYVHGNKAYEESEDSQAEIKRLNKLVYEGDPSIIDEYARGRELSLEKFEELYKILGTTFDTYYFESQTWKRGKELVEGGLSKGIFEESDGAIVYRGEKRGLHTRVFITSEGVPTYEAKDLGLAVMKAEDFEFDECLTVTAVEQKGYFEVVFAALGELRPELEGKFRNIPHGMMQLASGKMSSRLGNVITGESMLEEVLSDAYKKISREELSEEEKETVAERVGVAAIKYSILKQSLGKNILYDKEKALSFEGDSGPYLQYTDVRARSIIEKSEEEPAIEKYEGEIGVLEKLLARFPEVVERAGEELAPHYLVTYLTELAGAFNTFYATTKIIGSENERYHLAVAKAVSSLLGRGLELLGMKEVVRM